MTPSLTTRELEDFYDALAEAVDQAGDKSPLFLAKLALKLALDVGDMKTLMTALQVAAEDLTPTAEGAR